MLLKEFLNTVAAFDENSEILFSEDTSDFLNLRGDGHALKTVVEVNTGNKKYVVISE